MALIKYNRLPYQAAFDDSTKFYDCLFAGYGAGKTFALVMKMLKLAALNQGLAGGFLSPDMQMFKRDVIPTLEDISKTSGIRYEFKGNPARIELYDFGTTVYVFHGEDDGQSIRGPNLAWGVINEVTLLSEKAFKAFIARVRIKAASLRQIAMSGTPEGFTWAYDMFVADPRPDSDVFYGDMRLNRHIAEGYADLLVSSYDDIMQQLYVEGKFVNATKGAALYKFNRARHVVNRVNYHPELPVWVALDFNVMPMAATLFNRYPDKLSDRPAWVRGPLSHVKIGAFDEVNIHDGDTWKLRDAIRDKTPGCNNVILFPDPAGLARKTSAPDNITDVEILEEKFNDIRYNTQISVRSTLLAANSFLHKNLVILDKHKCKETIKDYEQVILKKGTNILDKKNLMRTHWVDGFKNMIDYEFPVIATGGTWRQMRVR